MVAKTARPASRHTSAAKAAPPVPFVFTSDGPDLYAEREPLFSIDGKVYTIPVEIPPCDALRYAFVWMEHGPTAAAVVALKAALGEDGYAALVGHRGLTPKQLNALISIVQDKFGAAPPDGDTHG